MPRTLSDNPCEVTFHDRLSDTRIHLFFRIPTREEREKYTDSLFTRNGTKGNTGLSEARRKYGAAILLGFKDGAFEKAAGMPLSSDPESPHYDKGWKGFVCKYAQDIVEMLAIHVFEASVVTAPPEEVEEKDWTEEALS